LVELPTYVILTRLTSEGLETVKEKPERILEVNRELEAMGVKVLSQYLLLGPYDFVNIVEAQTMRLWLRQLSRWGRGGPWRPRPCLPYPSRPS